MLPHAFTMEAVGFTALVANAGSFAFLCAYRGGDSNMRSAWICTRNDVLGNLAILLAALGVFGIGTGWPDLISLQSWRFFPCKVLASPFGKHSQSCSIRQGPSRPW